MADLRSGGRRLVLWALVALWACAPLAANANPRYASIIVDHESGVVIEAQHADAERYPASLTKMMTLYLTFEAVRAGELELDQRVPVSARAASMPRSRIGLSRGQKVKIRHLISVIAVRSANDAAVVLAEALAGSEEKFARLMTAKARELGMTSTTFRNASGLPNAGQVTTARDMAKLANRLIREFPEFYDVFGRRSVVWGGREQRSTNNLLRTYPGVDGLKTGFINASGFNLAASAVRNGRRIVAVVFGGRTAASRDRHMAKLLDRGFASTLVARVDPPEPPRRRPASAIQLASANGSLGLWSAPVRRPESRESEDVVVRGAATPERRMRDRAAATADAEQAARAAAAAELAERSATPVDAVGPLAPDDLVVIARPAGRGETVLASASSAPSPRREIAAASGDRGPVVGIPSGPIDGEWRAPMVQLPPLDARSSERRRWGVQVGAFVSRDQAERAAVRASRRAPEPLAAGEMRVSRSAGVDRPIFKARIVGFDRPTAERACAALSEARLDCLVIRADLSTAFARSSS